jgi:TolB protein
VLPLGAVSTAAPRSAAGPSIAYFGWNLSTGNSQEDLFAVDPVAGKIQRLTDDTRFKEFASDRDPAWSPDRRTIASARQPGSAFGIKLYLLDAGTGRTIRALVPGSSPEWYDADTLLFLRYSSWGYEQWQDVYAVDLATSAVTQLTSLRDVGGFVEAMSWHPSAGLAFGYSEVATTGYTASQVVTVPAAKVESALAGSGLVTKADMVSVAANATHPDWSPAGTELVYEAFTDVPNPDDPTATIALSNVVVQELATQQVTPITSDTAYGANLGGADPAFSPDGTQVAYVRGYEDEWKEIWVAPATGGPGAQLTSQNQRWFKGGLDW